MNPHPRRGFLRTSARLMLGGMMLPFAHRAVASLPNARSLAFRHTHTGEQLSVVYAVDDRYLPGALTALNHFLRDHYTGQVGTIDPQLFDLLFRLRLELGCSDPFHVISGYRCPETNAQLKATRGGGVARHSLHMDGKAIDIRLPGVPLADLRAAAIDLRQGGVGYYPREQFVHVDTGRVRTW
ncbi:MAG: DUF882 domain-containing protein [Rhodocyclaceae bacterium]|jgi:uncharacterized protein YcbK (DUF882 family)|nr:DUF882 domain-containing protein [Rhodocyclaceae bacterium]